MLALRPAALAALLLAACDEAAQDPVPAPAPTGVADLRTEGEPTEFDSKHLTRKLVLPPGVFPPAEAEGLVLPFMKDHPELFAGKRVFEIGTGSGIISLYAAQLGAKRVVCTDINPNAIQSVRANAERMGFAEVIDARLVFADDISAYAVIEADEVFDTLISNPPYALDLDAEHNTALVDKGDLGFSLVRGLKRHLAKDGVAALFYNTLFYHYVMVKFATYEGFDVRSHMPLGMSPWAFEALFNMYLGRLLEAEDLPKNAFRFYKEELPYAGALDTDIEFEPLFDTDRNNQIYRGFMVIRHQ